jgi:hypothetical protein
MDVEYMNKGMKLRDLLLGEIIEALRSDYVYISSGCIIRRTLAHQFCPRRDSEFKSANLTFIFMVYTVSLNYASLEDVRRSWKVYCMR